MASSPRSDVLRMGAVMVALLALTALVLLLTSGSSGGTRERVASRDGLLTVVEPKRIVLEPSDGGSPVTFALRPIDARRVDLVHLQAHRDQGLASRVFFEREDGRLYALRVDDLQTAP